MIILQMMKPAEGIYHEVMKEYTSFKRMDLMMKSRLTSNGEDYIFIGIYKGFLYSLSDTNFQKYAIITKSGEVVKDISINIKVNVLYQCLLWTWLMKEDIKHAIDGKWKFESDDEIPHFIAAVKRHILIMERIINPNQINDYNYIKELKQLEEICFTKPKKRKHLPFNFDEIKSSLYKPFNSILEKEQYSEEEIKQLAKGLWTEEIDFSLNQDWKKLLEEDWIHY